MTHRVRMVRLEGTAKPFSCASSGALPGGYLGGVVDIIGTVDFAVIMVATVVGGDLDRCAAGDCC